MFNLALLYEDGELGQPDFVKAKKYYKMGVDAGSPA
jgi:TPR repeat protein